MYKLNLFICFNPSFFIDPDAPKMKFKGSDKVFNQEFYPAVV